VGAAAAAITELGDAQGLVEQIVSAVGPKPKKQ
jgi:hypothetical protein